MCLPRILPDLHGYLGKFTDLTAVLQKRVILFLVSSISLCGTSKGGDRVKEKQAAACDWEESSLPFAEMNIFFVPPPPPPVGFTGNRFHYWKQSIFPGVVSKWRQ